MKFKLMHDLCSSSLQYIKEVCLCCLLNHASPVTYDSQVQYATFKTVHAFSFGNSTTLAKVSLSRNSIATLARNAFTHLPSLEVLSLGENHITEVNRHVFVDLPKLTKLYMDRNNITIIHDRAFQGLHSLVELDIFSNQIQVSVFGLDRCSV